MKLEVGKHYVRRDKLSVTTIIHKERTGRYPYWDHQDYRYNEQGQIDQSGLNYKNQTHPMDLIKEYK